MTSATEVRNGSSFSGAFFTSATSAESTLQRLVGLCSTRRTSCPATSRKSCGLATPTSMSTRLAATAIAAEVADPAAPAFASPEPPAAAVAAADADEEEDEDEEDEEEQDEEEKEEQQEEDHD